jgi:hypothetical protein
MIDMETAMTVTENCIKKVGRDEPIKPDDDLFSHGIDNELIDRLVNAIATDDNVGLPSLIPRHKINQNIFKINENSTVDEVATVVFDNAEIDTSKAKKRKRTRRVL